MDMTPDMFGYRPRLVEHRSYFALIPPPALALQIERNARDLGRLHNVRRVVRAGRLHVSLNGLQQGEALAPAQLDDALAVGAAVRRPAFDIVFDRIVTWDSGQSRLRHPVATVLCCSESPREAGALYEDLRRQMHQIGLPARRRQFNPHITLWYAPVRLAPIALTRPVRLRADRFCLVHTATGIDRPEHLASWPLRF